MGPLAGMLGGFAFERGIGTVDNLLGRPFQLWTAQQDAENAATVRLSAQAGNAVKAFVLPNPEALLSAHRRGLLTDRMAAAALRWQGIMAPMGTFGDNALSATNTRYLRNLWRNIALMGQSRPGVDTIMPLLVRKRLTQQQGAELATHLDVDWNRYVDTISAQYQQPSLGDLWQLWRLGRISDADYQLWTTRLGWFNADALALQQKTTVLPTLQEAMLSFWREGMDRQEWRKLIKAMGHTQDDVLRHILLANKPLPAPADLVRFAVREVWDTGVVQRWGYDAEFPEPFANWMKWHGLDWGQQFTLPNGQQSPLVTWPKAYWRAHWQPMPLGYSYQAYARFRPERIARYQERFPGLQPFTAQHLDDVIKVADYPPSVRSWLAALASPVLQMRQVTYAFREQIRDGNWALQQLLDRGYLREDALVILESERHRWEREQAAGIRRMRLALVPNLIRETIEGYREGLQTKEEAQLFLSGNGYSVDEANRAIDLVDLQENRRTIQSTVRLIRKGFLDGSFNYQETIQNLRNAGLTGNRVDQLVMRWRAERSLSRRALATGKLMQLVAEGALSPAIALQRLLNLGWYQPDAAALLGEAEMKLAQLQARVATAQARAQVQAQRSALAAQRQAAAALRAAQNRLRAITPLSTLRRWFQLGIRSAAFVRLRLAAEGYDMPSIDGYLSQWAIEYEGQHDTEPAAIANLETLYRKQTPVTTVKRWFQRGIVPESWTRARLRLMGFLPQSIEGYIREWLTTLPKGASGPAPEPTGSGAGQAAGGTPPAATVGVTQPIVNVPGTPGSRP